MKLFVEAFTMTDSLPNDAGAQMIKINFVYSGLA